MNGILCPLASPLNKLQYESFTEFCFSANSAAQIRSFCQKSLFQLLDWRPKIKTRSPPQTTEVETRVFGHRPLILQSREVFSVLLFPPPNLYKCFGISSLYNLLLMRSSFLLLTVALMLWSSYSSSIGVVGTVTQSTFQCLKTSLGPADYLDSVFVRLYRSTNTPVGIDPRGAPTIVNSLKELIYTIPYVQYCPGQEPVAQANAVDQVRKSILSSLKQVQVYRFSLVVQVKIVSTRAQECLWNLNTPTLNCVNLGLYVDTLRQKGSYPSILTSLRDWTRFFQGKCENFASKHNTRLVVTKYTSNGQIDPSGNKILPQPHFGGWSQVVGQKTAHNVRIPLNCGPTTRNITVERYRFFG